MQSTNPTAKSTAKTSSRKTRKPAFDGFDAWCRANGEHVTDNDGVVVEVSSRRALGK